jgi:hypothetical protein
MAITQQGGDRAVKDDYVYDKDAYQVTGEDGDSDGGDLMNAEDSINPSLVEALCQEILAERIASTVNKVNAENAQQREQVGVVEPESRGQQPPIPSPRKSLEFDQQREKLPGYDETSNFAANNKSSPVPPRQHADASSSTNNNQSMPPNNSQSIMQLFQLDKGQMMDIIRELQRQDKRHDNESSEESVFEEKRKSSKKPQQSEKSVNVPSTSKETTSANSPPPPPQQTQPLPTQIIIPPQPAPIIHITQPEPKILRYFTLFFVNLNSILTKNKYPFIILKRNKRTM